MDEFERNHQALSLEVALLPLLREEVVRARKSYHAGYGGRVVEAEERVKVCISKIKQLVEKM